MRATDSGDDPGAQPVRVRDESADQLEAIDWNDCFAEFAESGLAFLNQDKTADRGTSRFRRFVKPS